MGSCRFHVELHFSPGVSDLLEHSPSPAGPGFRPRSRSASEVCAEERIGVSDVLLFCDMICFTDDMLFFYVNFINQRTV